MRIGARKVLYDSDNPAHYHPDSPSDQFAVAGLINGRLLRQKPRHLDDPRLMKGKYLLSDSGTGNWLTEGGWYSPEEMSMYGGWAAKGAKNVRDILGLDIEESDDFVRTHAGPLQGMLFMPPDEPRHGPSTDYPVKAWYNKSAADSETSDRVHRTLIDSDMPSGLIKALRGQVNIELPSPDRAGWYNPPSGVVSLTSNSLSRPQTLIHELGHRADYRSHLAEGFARRSSPSVPTLTHPNPRLEGIADGFDDRYSARRVGTGDFSHITNTGGYTTNYRGQAIGNGNSPRTWSDSERAIYAAARAHFAETGENPTVAGVAGNVVLSNTDEYLHMMQRISPHARKALMENDHPTDTHGPLWRAAQGASHRYLSDRKIGTQLSLLPGMARDLYDDPYADGVSAEQHAKTVEAELAAQKQKSLDIRIIEE